MPAAKTTTPELTPAAQAAAEALRKRRERRDAGLLPSEVTPEQRAIAPELRERDHREGCPAYSRPDGPTRIEAYADPVIAPGPDLRALGVRTGDVIVVVRCTECGAQRYRSGFEDLDAFIDACLEKLATGDAPPPNDDELDGAL